MLKAFNANSYQLLLGEGASVAALSKESSRYLYCTKHRHPGGHRPAQ